MENLVLKNDSLYADGYQVQLPNGDIVLNREKIVYVPEVTDKRHPVIQGDTLTGLAYRYYRASAEFPEKYWWIIADANSILNPMDISELIGHEIVIPDFVKVSLQ